MDTINQIKTGSSSSFRSVFHQFHSKLYYYFLKKTRSGDLSRELVQLTFIKLWQFKHTLSEDLPFEIQLFNIANSSLIDFIRQQNSLRNRIVELPENAHEILNNQSQETADDFEHADYLQALIRSLSPVRQKIFILSRIHGHSYKEIAQKLSISVKTVEDHIGKALKHIRTLFF